MTKQEHEEIAIIIDELIERRFAQPQKPQPFAKIKAWLQEQGTQRGIVRILSAYLILQFNLDPELALAIVGGCLAVVGLHDAVTQG